MIDFIGTHTWEELGREWTLRAGGKGEIPFLPDQVGSAWNTSTQIDVAGINRMEKILILGECKWGQTASERPVLSSSIDKAARIVPPQGKWQIYFLGFSRSGWTNGAHSYREQVERAPPSGKNWRPGSLRPDYAVDWHIANSTSLKALLGNRQLSWLSGPRISLILPIAKLRKKQANLLCKLKVNCG